MIDKSLSSQEIVSLIKDAFSYTPISTRKAVKSLAHLLFHTNSLSHRPSFTPEQYKTLYFTILRAFSTTDPYLKSLLYSTVQSLRTSTKESFLAISSLSKDLNSDTEHLLKAKSLRTLFLLLPPTMICDFEKYITQSFLSKFMDRRDSSILCSYLFARNNKEIVRRWMMNLDLVSNVDIKDYHVLNLYWLVKEKGTMVDYVLENQHKLKGCAGMCGLRMVFGMCRDSIGEYRSFFLKMVRSNDFVVVIEACRVLISFLESKASNCDGNVYCNNVLDDDEVCEVMEVIVKNIRPLLISTKKHVQFAAVRTLLMVKENAFFVSLLNKDLENLVKSNNRYLSMMVITVLLRTGTEETVERLIDIVPDILSNVSLSYKKVVVDSLVKLVMKFGNLDVFMKFVKERLAEKGDIEFKRHIIKVVEKIVKNIYNNQNKKDIKFDDIIKSKNSEIKLNEKNKSTNQNNNDIKSNDNNKNIAYNYNLLNTILDSLSSYIEDSQSTILTMDILSLMGYTIGKYPDPNKYIVHIVNRLILEHTQVRCASLQSLFLISNQINNITQKKEIQNIINRFIDDNDIMVREEARFLMNQINKQQIYNNESFDINELTELKDCINKYINNETTKIFEKKENEDAKIEEDKNLIVDDNYIKTCKEIKVSKNNNDFNFYLSKKIYKNKVILVFRIENMLENVKFKGGIVNLLCRLQNGEKIKVEIMVNHFENEFIIQREVLIKNNNDQIKKSKDKSDIIEKDEEKIVLLCEKSFDINLENFLLFNGNFTFEICSDEDFEDTELEHINLIPFEINFIDFIEPFNKNIKSLPFEKSVKINLIAENARHDLKSMFNMFILNEHEDKNGFILEMIGKTKVLKQNNDDYEIIKIKFDTQLGICNVNVQGSNQNIVDKIVEKIVG